DAAGRVQALLLLGQAYANLKEWDQAATAFERAAQLSPASAEPRLAAADAWAAANQPESAVAAYRQAIKLRDQPETWLRLAHVLLVEVEFEVARAERSGSGQVALNRVRELLQEAENHYPESLELARRLVIAYQRFGFPNDADRVLRHLDERGDRSAPTVLLHAQVCTLRRDRDQGCKVLIEALESAPPNEQPSL